jgi:Effector Associated Constant Component 1
MEVEIQVVSAATAAGLTDLLTWLEQEHRLAGRVREHAGRPSPGEMGGAAGELLIATVTSGAVLRAVARCVVSWIQHRGAKIEVSLKADNGRQVEIRAVDVRRMSPGEIEQLVLEASRALAGGSD